MIRALSSGVAEIRNLQRSDDRRMAMTVRTCALVLGCLIATSVAGGAQAQSYPSKPVQIIADSSAGSTPDVALRFVTERLTQLWSQQILVVNRPGAGGSVAARAAADAAPDGYTLYQPVLSTFVALHPAAVNVPLHVPKDFIAMGFVAENPMFIAVAPSLGVNTLPELIALAKKKPGEITYATTGIGRLTHLTGELLQHEAKIKLQLVPYTGGPAHAISDVASGRVKLIIEGYSGIAGAVQSGQVKLIAVASAKRLPEFPNVPTVSETIPNFRATGWAVLVAPLGTPQAIVKKISADLHKVSSEPDLNKKLAALGSYANPMTADEATEFVHRQQATWQPVLDEIVKQQQQQPQTKKK
jgi:tripartite-type tricarboxylate transporter receptor subunit TctC